MRGPRRERDEGVSAVLGTILMLALMMTLVPGALLLRSAVSEEMEAHRSAAERAAWCARHPEIGPPDCPYEGPMPGYDCAEVEAEVWVCSRAPAVVMPTVATPAVTTVTPMPTTVL